MKIFNTCTTQLCSSRGIKLFDLLMWKASVISYKLLGYTLKLYCSSADITPLKQNGLYELYDEIDTTCFDQSKYLSKINLNKFWSSRKLEAINNEILLGSNAIYSDTDILMYKPINTANFDCIFWSEEPKGPVYLPWNNLSTPKNYKFTDSILNTDEAYNCGIMWFRDKNLFKYYYQEYLRFVIENPCKCKLLDVQNNLFACNAEQRILRGVTREKQAKVGLVARWEEQGFTDYGWHIFIYKALWKLAKNKPFNIEITDKLIYVLNLVKDSCLEIIKSYSVDLYNELIKVSYYSNYITEYK